MSGGRICFASRWRWEMRSSYCAFLWVVATFENLLLQYVVSRSSTLLKGMAKMGGSYVGISPITWSVSKWHLQFWRQHKHKNYSPDGRVVFWMFGYVYSNIIIVKWGDVGWAMSVLAMACTALLWWLVHNLLKCLLVQQKRRYRCELIHKGYIEGRRHGWGSSVYGKYQSIFRIEL